ncbi:MAG: hypothetical protein AB7U82_01045 [Blastocatellales bacterium]
MKRYADVLKTLIGQECLILDELNDDAPSPIGVRLYFRDMGAPETVMHTLVEVGEDYVKVKKVIGDDCCYYPLSLVVALTDE